MMMINSGIMMYVFVIILVLIVDLMNFTMVVVAHNDVTSADKVQFMNDSVDQHQSSDDETTAIDYYHQHHHIDDSTSPTVDVGVGVVKMDVDKEGSNIQNAATTTATKTNTQQYHHPDHHRVAFETCRSVSSSSMNRRCFLRSQSDLFLKQIRFPKNERKKWFARSSSSSSSSTTALTTGVDMNIVTTKMSSVYDSIKANVQIIEKQNPNDDKIVFINEMIPYFMLASDTIQYYIQLLYNETFVSTTPTTVSGSSSSSSSPLRRCNDDDMMSSAGKSSTVDKITMLQTSMTRMMNDISILVIPSITTTTTAALVSNNHNDRIRRYQRSRQVQQIGGLVGILINILALFLNYGLLLFEILFQLIFTIPQFIIVFPEIVFAVIGNIINFILIILFGPNRPFRNIIALTEPQIGFVNTTDIVNEIDACYNTTIRKDGGGGGGSGGSSVSSSRTSVTTGGRFFLERMIWNRYIQKFEMVSFLMEQISTYKDTDEYETLLCEYQSSLCNVKR